MTKKFRVSFVAVYAPVEPTDGDTSDSDEFYLQLQEQIDRVPGRNMVFLLGNFNAQVGRNRDRWYPSLGKFGIGKENSNGYRLLHFCRYKNLVITNTVFDHKIAHKLTWFLTDSKTTNLIDYVIVNRRLARSIQHTREVLYSSAVIDVKSKDHHLIMPRVNLELKFQGNYLPGSYNACRIKNENLRETFQEQLNTKLESLKFDNVEDGWNYFRKKICEVVDGVLRKKVRTPLGEETCTRIF
ncbi:craniofacial development protein 2-like [Artemia franciscana]|uniref:craniofacial development protein 2-like n=1 Tax=Artemia franciscana TaxID=6661 RepID=UPI0032DBC0BF